MSLTLEQKEILAQLSQCCQRIEVIAKSNFDLDAFINRYNNNGYAVYATGKATLRDEMMKDDVERIERQSPAKKLKKASGKNDPEKIRKTQRRH